MERIRIAVRQLIAFVMRSGDIDNSYRSNQRMVEGIKAHQRIQRMYGEGYRKEVPFTNQEVVEDILFEVEGRADGVFSGEIDGVKRVIIDEIKSTARPLKEIDAEENQLHWAQAKCYGYFLCKEQKREEVDIQLTYVNTEEEELTKRCVKTFSLEELKTFYFELLERYLRFSRALIAWKRERNEALRNLHFPYQTYRQGQRQMAVGIYESIEKGENLFIEAPTGIGKTISAIVPALSSLLSFDVEKIFYLTARTTTQKEAEKAIQLLVEGGTKLKSIRLTAKEKICLNSEMSCNPADCPYAKGHFDRVNDAILELFSKENQYTALVIQKYAEAFRVCPHEFQLDMSDYSDFVLCDYNYAFDPRMYLRRAFDDKGNQVLLVDEAHNLVERGREMYSATLSTAQLEDMRMVFPKKTHRSLYQKLEKAERHLAEFLSLRSTDKEFATEEENDTLYFDCKSILISLDDYLLQKRQDPYYEDVRNFSFSLLSFVRIYEYFQEGFFHILKKEGNVTTWKIQCIDTSLLFSAMLKRVRCAIFFSATLSPLSFYTDLLGGGDHPNVMRLDLPFPERNLELLQFPISTRYSDREKTMPQLVRAIYSFVHVKRGNYMIFFPSYQYMEQTYCCYREIYGEEPLTQSPQMTREERRRIWNEYDTKREVIGFFVLGGLFSEGVDFAGERLIGCGIVSVGLPGISFERNQMKSYFDRKANNGFDYAYVFPGMNKILQAAGRVIRDETDRGAVVLFDDRFAKPAYLKLMPRHWKGLHRIRPGKNSLWEMEQLLHQFWQKEEE